MGVLEGIRWYVTNLMGDNAYQRYLEHLSRVHPDAGAISEKEYWRERHADADARPGARCC